MRLSKYQLDVIKYAVKDAFGEDAALFLFGSRVDDQARGGDVDLFIETSLGKHKAYQAELKLFTCLQKQLGEQKIDIVVQAEGSLPLPVYQEARRTGVRL